MTLPSSADEWAKDFGTIQSFKRSESIEDDQFLTESLSGNASNREVDAFYIEPNALRNLKVGQSVIKYSPDSDEKGMEACIVNHGIMNLPANKIFLIDRTGYDEKGSYLLELRKNDFFGDEDVKKFRESLKDKKKKGGNKKKGDEHRHTVKKDKGSVPNSTQDKLYDIKVNNNQGKDLKNEEDELENNIQPFLD